MFANVFLILTAYYVLKVVREGLTIGGIQPFGLGGDEIKAYLPAVMTVLLLGVVPLYGALARATHSSRIGVSGESGPSECWLGPASPSSALSQFVLLRSRRTPILQGPISGFQVTH
jgi:hypothetical protein